MRYHLLTNNIFKVFPFSNIFFHLWWTAVLFPARTIWLKQDCTSNNINLKNFANLKQICTCQSLFFNKVAGFRSPTLLKKRLRYSCLPVNVLKLFPTPFFADTNLWKNEMLPIFRSSHSQMFLKNFQNSQKNICVEPPFQYSCRLEVSSFIKNLTAPDVFSSKLKNNICNIFLLFTWLNLSGYVPPSS